MTATNDVLRSRELRLELLVLFASVCMSGCDLMTAGFMPAVDKINAAFPIAQELQLARGRLVATLESDKPAQQRFVEQFNQMLEIRALTCSAQSPIGRFDTVAQIKSKVADTPCFAKQDAALDEWISARRIGIALRGAPLVPFASLGTKTLLPNNMGDGVSYASAAAQANVLALKNYQEKYVILQVPEGRQISTFAGPRAARGISLSPNGRLLAVAGIKELQIHDAETGNLLWTTDKYSEVIAWMPQLELIVLSQAATQAPYMLDARTGTFEAYPATERSLTWAIPVSEGKYMVGSYTTASLMEHTRNAAGSLDIVRLKQWQLPNPGIAGVPRLTNQGNKLWYASGHDLASRDLETNQQELWKLSVTMGSLAKISDTTLLFEAAASQLPAARWLLDVEKNTVQSVKELGVGDGRLLALASRNGYLKHSQNAIMVGSTIEGENPQPFDAFYADWIAQQLTAMNKPAGDTPMRSAYIEGLASGVRAANTRAMIRDGLPREIIDAERQGRGLNSSHARSRELKEAYAAAAGRAYGGNAPPLPGAQPLLANIPADARVSIIGVYEADTTGSRAPSKDQAGAHQPGKIRVNVAQGGAPVVLVLSSYEPVNWIVNADRRRIAAVLISSYHPSTVVGHGNAQVVRIGSRYAYKMNTREYEALQEDVAQYVSNPVQGFQGSYKGQEFLVQ